MIYFIYFLGTVIIGTLIFISLVMRWFLNEKFRSQFVTTPMIIERAYRGRDFFSSFVYSTKDQTMRNAYPRSPNEIVIMDEEHKKYIINQYSKKLVDEMLKAGCIEIKEEDYMSPFQKRVYLKVKVYQPE